MVEWFAEGRRGGPRLAVIFAVELGLGLGVRLGLGWPDGSDLGDARRLEALPQPELMHRVAVHRVSPPGK